MSIFNKKAVAGIFLLSVLVFPAVVSATESYGPPDNYGGFPAGSSGVGPMFVAFILAALAVTVLQLVAMYKVFEMAGKPGWAVIVPVYNTWVLAEVGGKPGWLGIVAAVISAIPLIGPIVSLVLWIMIMLGVSNSFGRGTGFGLGLAFLPFIFFPILAFSGGSGSTQVTIGTFSVQPISEETTPASASEQQKTPINV